MTGQRLRAEQEEAEGLRTAQEEAERLRIERADRG